jgi:hypothetical protein
VESVARSLTAKTGFESPRERQHDQILRRNFSLVFGVISKFSPLTGLQRTVAVACERHRVCGVTRE